VDIEWNCICSVKVVVSMSFHLQHLPSTWLHLFLVILIGCVIFSVIFLVEFLNESGAYHRHSSRSLSAKRVHTKTILVSEVLVHISRKDFGKRKCLKELFPFNERLKQCYASHQQKVRYYS